ncbi:hypothetical protein [Paenibacillus mesotrionivorans]|uniref:Uncharacterized protein n=1 Tax=Paenibacillus mesotrionivorans TaxID=3160968 RepID=A0ACC7NY86_9BACL
MYLYANTNGDDLLTDDIIRFYKENITSYSLVFKHMKLTYRYAQFSIFNFIFSNILFIVNLIVTMSFKNIGIPIYFFVSIILFILFPVALKRKAIKILRRRYNIRPNGKGWRTREFDEMRLKKMVDYLNKYDLYSDKKIVKIKEILQKKIESNKLPPLLAPGLALAFIGPIWVEYVKYSFGKNSASQMQAIGYMSKMWVVILLCIIVFSFIKYAMKSIREIFSFSDTIIMAKLIEFLDEVQLTLPPEALK